MDTFGERLEHERRDRGLTNQAVSESVRLDEASLMALERSDFAALPDEATVMDGLRRYAELLGVDADLMIADYSQEREKYLKELERRAVEPVGRVAPSTLSAEVAARPRVSPGVVVLVVVTIALLGALWLLTRGGGSPTREASVAASPAGSESAESNTAGETASTPQETARVAQPPVETPRELTLSRDESAVTPPESQSTRTEPAAAPPDPASSRAGQTATPADVTPTSAEPPGAPSAPASSDLSSLSITEYGVGTAVEDRRLVGQNDRFEEGTPVAFWTRVEGAAAGDWIAHVWLMEGQIVARRKLEIGGPNWRTFTVKTIDGGVGSVWAVEARDSTGRVLARSEFISSP